MKKLTYIEIEVDDDPFREKPLYTNETVDPWGTPYKRVVCSGSYSRSKERLNLGGGAVAYFINSFFCVKTGPSYAKGMGIEKHWKWSLEIDLVHSW